MRIAWRVDAAWRWTRGQMYLRPLLWAGLRETTMLQSERLVDLVFRVDSIVDRGIEGSFVECGTWRGGASFLMAKRLAHHHDGRPVWMFDSFEGLPAPAPVDGERAPRVASDPNFHNNETADVDQVRADARRLGVDGQVRIVKGWFDETLAATRDQVGKIALLRLDGVWYNSVKACLDVFGDAVVPGGLIVVDDYYDFPGAARALHEFLASREARFTVRTTGGLAPCVVVQVEAPDVSGIGLVDEPCRWAAGSDRAPVPQGLS